MYFSIHSNMQTQSEEGTHDDWLLTMYWIVEHWIEMAALVFIVFLFLAQKVSYLYPRES